MSVINQTTQVFGNIAALRTLNENFPSLKTTSSFPSASNHTSTLTFLTDLLKALVGYNVLVTTVGDILTYNLAQIEKEVKTALKTQLKSIVSCGLDPSLPSYLKSTGTGINVTVSQIDFLNLMMTDPNTPNGMLLYNNVTPTYTNSTDLNTVLYGTIQNEGAVQPWGANSPIGRNIINMKFNSQGTGSTPNNTITINANSNYDSKTLTDLNNDFVDSMTLFNSQNVVNRVIDTIFGSVSVSVNKTRKQQESEAQINSIIDSIVNTDVNDVIDDGYFVFTNQEIAQQQQQVDLLMKGIVELSCCNTIAASVPVSFLNELNNNLTGTTSVTQQRTVIANSLDAMATQNAANSTNPTDTVSIKLNFIQQILDNLTKAIMSIVLSPKLIMIFTVNYNIIYGQTATFTDGVDFLKKNQNLISNIIKQVSYMILEILLALALKQIATMVATAALTIQTEKAKANLAQLLSLVGVPESTLQQIQGLI